MATKSSHPYLCAPLNVTAALPSRDGVYFMAWPCDLLWPIGHWQTWHKQSLEKSLRIGACCLTALGTLKPRVNESKLLENEEPPGREPGDPNQLSDMWARPSWIISFVVDPLADHSHIRQPSTDQPSYPRPEEPPLWPTELWAENSCFEPPSLGVVCYSANASWCRLPFLLKGYLRQRSHIYLIKNVRFCS